jgi:hypothetical protein
MKRASALLLAAAAMSAGTAQAFVRTTTDKNAAVRWPRTCVELIVHTASPPPNETPEMVVNAARAAAATWSHEGLSCSGFELLVTTDDMVAMAAAANDGRNHMFFRQDAWPYEPSALAITTVFARQDNGTILDADVELNAVAGGRFKWGDLVAGLGTGIHVEDLQNTLTHEFGHFLGLDHNCYLSGSNAKRGVDQNGVIVPECDQASSTVMAATMFAAVAPGDVERRTLTDDDIAGVCAIYPAGSYSARVLDGGAISCTGTGGGNLANSGCSLGGRQGSAAGLLLAGLLVSAAARRRSRRRG